MWPQARAYASLSGCRAEAAAAGMSGRERNGRVQKQVLEFRGVCLSAQEDWWAADAEDWAPNGERRGVKTPFCAWSGSEQAGQERGPAASSPCGSFKGSGCVWGCVVKLGGDGMFSALFNQVLTSKNKKRLEEAPDMIPCLQRGQSLVLF